MHTVGSNSPHLPPPAMSSPDLSQYKHKLLCAIFYAKQRNPGYLEAPWYEAWDLVLNEFIREEEEYSICPQAVLRIKKTKTHSRYPDFVTYLTTSFGTSLQDFTAARRPIILIEVKPWLPAYANNRKLEDCFEDSSMMGQLVEQGKFVFEQSNVEVQANTSVVVVLAAGHMWRSAKLYANDISPFNPRNIPKNSPSNMQLRWSSDTLELGTKDSDKELLKLKTYL